MPITQFLDGQTFDPEVRRIMGLAYEMARSALRLTDPDDIADEAIARKI
jgi:hypothetical protein